MNQHQHQSFENLFTVSHFESIWVKATDGQKTDLTQVKKSVWDWKKRMGREINWLLLINYHLVLIFFTLFQSFSVSRSLLLLWSLSLSLSLSYQSHALPHIQMRIRVDKPNDRFLHTKKKRLLVFFPLLSIFLDWVDSTSLAPVWIPASGKEVSN